MAAIYEYGLCSHSSYVTFQVLQRPETTSLGLVMVRITSEELASPSEDLSEQRKEELRKLLLLQVPGLLTMLGTFLENILEKHRRIVSTATPPPSPTHGESSLSAVLRGESELDFSSLSPPHSNNNRHSPLIGRLLNSTNKVLNNLVNPLPPLDPDSEELSSLALACLAHLFSWIPLSTCITPSLLATVFCFAEFGCDVLAQPGTGHMTAGSTRLGKDFSVLVVAFIRNPSFCVWCFLFFGFLFLFYLFDLLRLFFFLFLVPVSFSRQMFISFVLLGICRHSFTFHVVLSLFTRSFTFHSFFHFSRHSFTFHSFSSVSRRVSNGLC